mmetsp:Transcript_9594/g.21545  ORF Transcript_9594/g.21545 Transcript_9594/m.21545 type:complete len:250 (-) Transcript_9594:156-905(-)
MYVLLGGSPPFYGDDDRAILKMVKAGKFDFPDAEWNGVSDQAKDLICAMLTKDTAKRCSSEQALQHPWTQLDPTKHSTTAIRGDFVGKLKEFHGRSKFKQMAMTSIAHNMSEKDIEEMKKTFVALDENGDGVLTYQEIVGGLEKHNIQLPAGFREVFDSLDSDRSGSIEYTEFLAATIGDAQFMNEKKCWQAFKVFDRDGNGKITRDELKLVLQGDEIGLKDAAAMIAEFDQDGDGEIDFDEFMAMMRK